jgi:hypothetical protein
MIPAGRGMRHTSDRIPLDQAAAREPRPVAKLFET